MSLCIGSIGAPVMELQGDLNLLPTQLPLLKIDGIFGVRTQARVREFQGLNDLGVDGIAGSLTLAAIELAASLLKKIVPPSATITVTQKNPVALTAAHDFSTPIVLPPITLSHGPSFTFGEVPATAKIHDFLFQILKGSSVFWMGAAVPLNTTDFTRAYVFFHPTVKQGGTVVAADEDYPKFEGGWSLATKPVGSIQRYVALEGVQLATAGLNMPMLVPFTTMAAVNSPATSNMFSTDPVDTITAVLGAIQNEMTGRPMPKPTLVKLGAASFSSGIHALRLFLGAMARSRLVKEVIDLDSPVIGGNRRALTTSVGAVSKCFAQVPPERPAAGYVTVTRGQFARVSAYGHLPEGPPFDFGAKFNQRLHARIGWMMYHQALMHSALR